MDTPSVQSTQSSQPGTPERLGLKPGSSLESILEQKPIASGSISAVFQIPKSMMIEPTCAGTRPRRMVLKVPKSPDKISQCALDYANAQCVKTNFESDEFRSLEIEAKNQILAAIDGLAAKTFAEQCFGKISFLTGNSTYSNTKELPMTTESCPSNPVELCNYLNYINYNKQAFDPRTIFAVIAKLYASIYILNEAGYVHRDIKPDNILLDLNEGVPSPNTAITLVDYGFACISSAEKLDSYTDKVVTNATNLTSPQASESKQEKVRNMAKKWAQPQAALGTPHCLSPNTSASLFPRHGASSSQDETEPRASHKRDVWAVGVTVVNLLTGYNLTPRGRPPTEYILDNEIKRELELNLKNIMVLDEETYEKALELVNAALKPEEERQNGADLFKH